MDKHAASSFITALTFAGGAAAQAPATPQVDPKAVAPAAATTQNPQRNPTPSRNQFFTPVMGINIEGEGLALPKGVAEEMPINPAAEPPAAPQPSPTPK